MADFVNFNLGFETSAAYRSVDRLASYTQKKFSAIRLNNLSGPQFESMERSARKFSKTLEFANDRMVAFAASTSVVYGLGKAFLELYRNALQAEKALANIQVNIKLTSSEMNSLTSDLFKAANQTGQSFYVAAEAAAEFGRQGLKAVEVAKATKAALVLSQISGLEAADSVKALTSAMNTFGEAAVNYESLVNKMAAADTNFAVSSKDLADAISRVGSTAKDAGVSVDQLLATVTSLQQTTARGGAVIGNSLKTIFTRLQRNDVAAALENIGVKVKDSDGNFLNQISVLQELAEAYENLSASQRSAISEKLGGVYQINIVKGILQDLSKGASTYSQALATVEKAQNEAFAKSEFLGKTTLNKINTAKNSFIQLSEAIGSIGATDTIGRLATEFSVLSTDLAESIKKPLEEKSAWEKVGTSFVQGLISAISGPALGTALIGIIKIGSRVIRNVAGDLGSTFSGNGQSQLFSRLKSRSDEAKQSLLILQNERDLQNEILKGNRSLAQRLALMSRINGGNIPMPQIPNSSIRIKNKADGFLPAMEREAFDIASGVGGAGKQAKPLKKKVRLTPGKTPEDVVVNTHEVIVRNYMNSGADAVFNQNMINKIGGRNNLFKLGKVENFSGGFDPKNIDFVKSLKGISQDYGKNGIFLGGGIEGSFYALRGGVGVKRFHGADFGEHDKDSIQSEYAWSRLLSEHSIIPGVGGPKVVGTLANALKKGRIGKEVIAGKMPFNERYMPALKKSLNSMFNYNGVPSADLHGANMKLNDAAHSFLANPKRTEVLDKRNQMVVISDLLGKRTQMKKLSLFFKRMEKKGGKISIIDPGMFGSPYKTGPYKNIFEKYSSMARGFIPNFANGKTPTYYQLNTKALIEVLKDPNSLDNQKELALKVLKSRGVLDDPRSITLGLPKSFLSDRAIVSSAKASYNNPNDIFYSSFTPEIEKRGVLSDPSSAFLGLPIEAMKTSALVEIRNNSSQQYGMYSQKANTIISNRANDAKQRSNAAIAKNRQLALTRAATEAERKRQIDLKRDNPVAAFLANQRGGDISDYMQLMRGSASRFRAEYQSSASNQQSSLEKNAAAQSLFSKLVADEISKPNPQLNKKNVLDFARLAGSQTGGSVSKEQIKETNFHARNDRWSRHSDKISKVGFAATLGAGALGSLTGNESIGNVASLIGFGSSVGSAFGPVGTAVGVAAGAFVGLADAAKKASIPLDKVESSLQDLNASSEKIQSSIQGFFSSSEALNSALKNPNASRSELALLSRKRASSLVDLSQEQRAAILGAKDDKELRDVTNEISLKSGSKTSASLALGTIVSNANKNNSSFGVLFREFFNSREEGKINLDKTELVKSFENLFSNIQKEDLQSKADAGNFSAKRALEAYDAGDIKAFISNTRELGLIDKNTANGALSVIDNTNKKELNSAISIAKESTERLALYQKESADAIKNTAVSFEDFKEYLDSLNRSSSLERIIASSRSNVTSNRLDLVAQNATESTRGTIDYAKVLEQSKAEFSRTSADLSKELINIFSESYGSLGRNAFISKDKNFVSSVLSSGGDPKKIESLLADLDKISEKENLLSEDQKNSLNDIKTRFAQAKLDLVEQKQIALDQLTALQDILKKQQFDKLISTIRERNPLQEALKDSSLSLATNSLLSPSSKEKRKNQIEVSNALTSRNPDSIASLIISRLEKSRSILKADDERSASGVPFLSRPQRTKILSDFRRDELATTIDQRLALGQSNVRASNAIGKDSIARSLENARLTQLGFYGGQRGSIENINRTIDSLNSLSPSDKSLQDEIRSLVSFLSGQRNLQLGSSGIYSQAILDLKQQQDFKDTSVGGKKLTELLEEAISSLNNGDASSAIGSLNSILSSKDISGVVKNAILDISSSLSRNKFKGADASLDKSTESNVKSSRGITDFSLLFIKSTDGLTKEMGELSKQVESLKGVLEKQATIALESSKIKIISDAISEKQTERNKLVSSLEATRPTTAQEIIASRLINDREIADWARNEVSTVSKEALNSSGDKRDELQKTKNALQFFETVLLKGNINTSQNYDKNATSNKEDREKAEDVISRVFLRANETKNASARKFVSEFEMNALPVLNYKNNESSSAEKTQIESLDSAVKDLNTQLKQAIESLKSVKEAGGTESKSTTSLDINLNGKEFNDSILSKIQAAVVSVVSEQILNYAKNPKIFESKFGGNTRLS